MASSCQSGPPGAGVTQSDPVTWRTRDSYASIMGSHALEQEILPSGSPASSDPRLSTTLGLLGLLGITDREVRRGRPTPGIPWLAVFAMGVAGLVVFAVLNIGQYGIVDLLVVALYAAVIALLTLVLLRAALAIRVEHPVIAGVVAVGGVVLVVVYWVLVHFITVPGESRVTPGTAWGSLVLALVVVGLTLGAVKVDAATREWLAGPLRRVQAEIVGYPPEPIPGPVPGLKEWLRNPASLVLVAGALVTGAVAGLKKR